MSKICEICGKGAMRGNQISITRSQVSRRTTKFTEPNLQKETVNIDGKDVTLKICTKCKKSLK